MVMVEPVATLVAPAAGEVEVTVGGVVSGAVVNEKVRGAPASAFPARSLIPAPRVTVYVVPAARGAEGVNVAEVAVVVTVPVTPPLTESWLAFSVEVSIGSLKVTVIAAP